MSLNRAAHVIPIKFRKRSRKTRLAVNASQEPTLRSESIDPPTEHLLFKRGLNKTSKGTFLFDDVAATEVMKRANEWGNDFHGDWHHDSIERKPGDPPADATVWFNLEVRDGALYATRMRWEDSAAQRLRKKKFRYFSNVFLHEPLSKDEQKKYGRDVERVVEYINLGLTNDPAANRIAPLVAASRRTAPAPQETPKMERLLALLGLTKSATEEEAIAALEKKLGTKASPKAVKMLERLMKASKETDPEKAAGKIEGLVAMATALKKKSMQYGKAMKRMKKQKKLSLLSRAVKSGAITPAQKKQLAKKKLSFVEAFLEVTPKGSKAPGKTGDRTSEPADAPAGDGQFTKLEKDVLEQLGLTDDKGKKAYLESKKRNGGHARAETLEPKQNGQVSAA